VAATPIAAWTCGNLEVTHPARAADALFSLIKTNLWLIIASFVKELRI
jgi:hypothetical protein